MNCPYCGAELESGVLQAGNSIIWTPKAHKLSLNPRADGRDIVLDRNYLTSPKIAAHNCAKCRKIIVAYDETNDTY